MSTGPIQTYHTLLTEITTKLFCFETKYKNTVSFPLDLYSGNFFMW